MRFEWDEQKATTNLAKHGVTFQKAITAFDDPFALITLDQKHSISEKREWLLGKSDAGILVVIFTTRQPGDVFRIISARKANKKERERYEQIKKLSI